MTLDPQTKSLLMSKTVWGAAIAGVSMVAQVFTHHSISAADQTQIVSMIPQVIDWVSTATGIAGSLFAIYGRAVATQKIS